MNSETIMKISIIEYEINITSIKLFNIIVHRQPFLEIQRLKIQN